ncbi:SpoIIE family protein phosphatase [Edaphobacter albus]|uniref:SpoIIE family protein phosphatase n=1 Tax=Edaphobacter sp. 4G125 TaxID=2763071 RepID=UPI001646F2EE|nr:SpoIIE family protein phosphatase [Edaphobacter sp. 4G125]QNI37770.1 SpoIIE family protein phosphatase [Edaphobacter sp. 4G125]
MWQRSARLQYIFLALVAALALTHVYLGIQNTYQNLANGQLRSRLPFYDSYYGPFVAHVNPEGRAAGLENGDPVLAVNQRPYSGGIVLLQAVRSSQPGQPLEITYRRGESSAVLASVVLRAERDAPSSMVAWVLHFAFLLIALLCLLVGIYVVFARPHSLNAWLILGILAYFDPLFIDASQLSGSLRLVAQVWSDLAQTAMPLCLMSFGIYFPERSSIDVRFPWIKWVIAIPILILFPTDLLYIYGHGYNFAASAWLDPWFYRIAIVEDVFAALAISCFFLFLAPKLVQSRGDARRRLRILYFGSFIGLTPAFVLFLVSLIRKSDFGQDISNWIMVPVLAVLLLFPISLAYVVVVQRAMDLRLLIRQGTKYFFARSTIFVASILLAGWMSYALSLFLSSASHRHPMDFVRIFAIIGLFFFFRFVLSRRLQQRIDQKFFREAYSSEQVLSELSEEARNFTEVEPLLHTITQRISDTLHIDRIAVFLHAGDHYRLQLATGIPVTSSMMPPILGSLSLAETSATITNLTRGRAPATIYRDDPSSWLLEATETERTALNDLSAELLVPLPGRKKLAGVMALGPKRSEEPYTRMDKQLLQSVATQAGLALENAELLESLSSEIAHRERVSREIEIAREVQERLFPQGSPRIEGVDLAGFCRPAQVVGGDYFDFFLLSGSPVTSSEPSNERARLALALGDISGKGISAALLMASLRASLRSAAQLQPGDLATLMNHVNRLVYESSTANRYATFFYAEYDPHLRRLTYVNAGHNPPAILRGETVLRLEATGTVIGLLPDTDYTCGNIYLQPGDVFLAFTDGISEAMNAADEEWGEDCMIDAARALLRHPDCIITADQLLQCIFQEADRFTAGAPQHDDMTLLVCMIR